MQQSLTLYCIYEHNYAWFSRKMMVFGDIVNPTNSLLMNFILYISVLGDVCDGVGDII